MSATAKKYFIIEVQSHPTDTQWKRSDRQIAEQVQAMFFLSTFAGSSGPTPLVSVGVVREQQPEWNLLVFLRHDWRYIPAQEVLSLVLEGAADVIGAEAL